jgi:hypothetical protein
MLSDVALPQGPDPSVSLVAATVEVMAFEKVMVLAAFMKPVAVDVE